MEGDAIEENNISGEEIGNAVDNLNEHKMISKADFVQGIQEHDAAQIKIIIKEISDIKVASLSKEKKSTLAEIEDLSTKMKSEYPQIHKALSLKFQNFKHSVDAGDFAKIEQSANSLEEAFSQLVIYGKAKEFKADINAGIVPKESLEKSDNAFEKNVAALENAQKEAEKAILKVKSAIQHLEDKSLAVSSIPNKGDPQDLVSRNPLRKFLKSETEQSHADVKEKIEIKKEKLETDAKILKKALNQGDTAKVSKKIEEIHSDSSEVEDEQFQNKNELEMKKENAKQELHETSTGNSQEEDKSQDFKNKFKIAVTSLVESVEKGNGEEFEKHFDSLKATILLGIEGVKTDDLQKIVKDSEAHIQGVFGKCGKELVEALQLVFIGLADDLEEIEKGLKTSENADSKSDLLKLSTALTILKNAVVRLEKSRANDKLDKLCSSPSEDSESSSTKDHGGPKVDSEKEEREKNAKVIEPSPVKNEKPVLDSEKGKNEQKKPNIRRFIFN